MSTKVTIKERQRGEGRIGFHLYHDLLDKFQKAEGEETPVYLRLEGVAVQLETLSAGGAVVTIAIPAELAQALGLLQPQA